MKKVIITGVSEWLWYETAKILLERGVEVVWISRNTPNIAITHIACDFTLKESLENCIQEIKQNHTNFDALINCAWIMSLQEIDTINYEELEKLFRINVFAPIQLVSWLFNEIKNNSADIVNVASTVGFKAYESQCAYWASKWSLRWVNENLRLEFKWTKTRIIWFNPGGFKSKIFEKATGIKADLSAYMEAEDVAKVLIQTLELPKNMEVSEIIINRK